MHKACDLLDSPAHTVCCKPSPEQVAYRKEVAWMTGFSNPYYFSGYLKVMGESPDNWRNKKGAVPNASKP